MWRSLSLTAALGCALGLTGTAFGGGYTFTRLVDHVDHNFSPRSFQCASVNDSGDVAFKASRSDGLSSWEVVAKVSRTGVLTTVVEEPSKSTYQFFSSFVSINDSGQISFVAFLSNDTISVLRADGTTATTIANTAGSLRSVGFDTQVNNAGEVAFTGQLDDGTLGLFSGTGGALITHYLDTTPVLVDGVTTDLSGGNFGRPAVNNAGGEIAFHDRVEPSFDQGVFAGRQGVFRTLGPTETNRQYRDPNLNDLGIGAFETSFFNAAGQFVNAIVTSNGGVLSTVADTLNGYGGFGFYAPSINNRGQVAFEGLLSDFSTDGVFTGPSPKKNAVITSAGKLDGMRIVPTSISFCAEGLNSSDEVVFSVDLEDPSVEFPGFRSAIYLATPNKTP